MATATTADFGIQRIIFDDMASLAEPVSPIYSTQGVVKWETGRLQARASRSDIGFHLHPYGHGPLPESLLENGIPAGRRDLRLEELTHIPGSTSIWPSLREGQYRMAGHDFVLRAGRRVAEVFNGTSLFFATEQDRRHRFSQTPDWSQPITAILYERNAQGGIRYERQWRLQPQFTIDPSSTNNLHTNSGIDWSIVETGLPECMVDVRFASSQELVFNEDVGTNFVVKPQWTMTSSAEATTVLPTLLRGLNPYIQYLPQYPVDTSNFTLYGRQGTAVTEWSQTSQFSAGIAATDLVYILNEKAGEVILNTAATSIPDSMYCAYTAVPLIEYDMPTRDGRYYAGIEAPLQRTPTKNQSSTLLTLFDSESASSIKLEVSIQNLTRSGGNSWTGAFYGDPSLEVRVRATAEDGSGVAHLPVTLWLQNSVGSLLGGLSDGTVTLLTDDQGYASFFYTPPGFAQAQITRWERNGSDPKQLDLIGSPVSHDLVGDISDIYTYIIYKDDPLLGRIADASNPAGTIAWDSVRLNGRRLILYQYDAFAKHPLLDVSGAYVPVRPVSWTESTIRYKDDLPAVDPADDNNWLGGYAVMGPRLALLQVYVSSSLLAGWQKPTPALPFDIRVDLSPYAKGDYVTGGENYSFGYRLPGDSISPSSQFGGALFYTLNPVSGTIDVLFETSTQQKATEGGFEIHVEVVV